MTYIRRNSLKSVALFALASVPKLVFGHSWVEQANRISPNGTLVGPPGFPPKWAGRQAPGYNDQVASNPLRVDQVDLCLKQPIGQQIDGFPELIAAPGDFVALRYLENGHVTKQEPNRPLQGGVVYVYGTTDPRPNESIVDVHRKWTADGTGGDGRGRLLATRHYDDGQCYEANGESLSVERQQTFPKANEAPFGPNLWCQTDFQIPEDVPQGSQYAVYWVWTWPLLVNNEGSESGEFREFPPHAFPAGGEQLIDEGVRTPEVYSSCLSINIQGEALVQPEAAGVKKFSTDRFINDREDWNNAANRRQLETQFEIDPNGLPDADPPANGGAPPPPPADETQAPAPTPTTTRGGMRTVTVTADPITTYVTATVTTGADNNDSVPTGAPQGEAPEAVPSVEPFIPPTRRAIKPRRSSWSFGRKN